MIQWLAAFGAAGCSTLYAVNPWPSCGVRRKNAVGILIAALVGLALWQAGVTVAWTYPVSWCGAFLLLWASQFEAGLNDLIWVRAAAATGLAVLSVQFFG